MDSPLSSTRHLQSTARLALLAMFLLLAAPLLSQGLAQVQAGGLPAWLDELACGDAAPAQHGGQAAWAKCGYCTLLLASPALPGALPAMGAMPLGVSAQSGRPLAGGFQSALALHDAPPRAPPHLVV